MLWIRTVGGGGENRIGIPGDSVGMEENRGDCGEEQEGRGERIGEGFHETG
jgi:hypothetical protein